ncbi:MAG: BCCT family transporter, partial [Anaerolineae bacterium]|nr:BCCT family transporter [Anaerolineae bacterium]
MNTRATTAATGLVGLWVMLGTWRPDLVAEALSDVRSATGPTLGWYYVLLVTVILVIVLWLGLGRYRNVRLSKDNERPEFGMVSWIAMLFAAGTGVGLLFWSIAEPISHFQGNPFSGKPGTAEAAVDAARLTLFHWGLHGWSIFALMGAMLAYFSYRGNLPLTTRSALYPLIGERIYGWRGDLVDTFAVVSTVFGIATTLGLGAAQMNAGLHWLIGIDISVGRQLTIILFVTSLAIFSVVSGVRRGVRWLSIGNMWLGVGLLMFFLIVGPTSWLLRFIIQTAGSYGQHLIEMSFWTNVTGTSGWQQSWTVFYWGWWLSWTPFVG